MPPVPDASGGARTARVPATFPPESGTWTAGFEAQTTCTLLAGGAEVVAFVNVAAPVRAIALERAPSTSALPPTSTSTVPLSLTRAVAPVRLESWVTSWSRWSMSSFAEPPALVIDRILALRSATEDAVVFTSLTMLARSLRLWDHSVEADVYRVLSRSTTACESCRTTDRVAAESGVFARSDHADHIVLSWLDSPVALGSPTDDSRFAYDAACTPSCADVPVAVRRRASRNGSPSREMPVTVAPFPELGTLEYIDGVDSPPIEEMSARCRVYPTVLALAMFWPATSRACRWAIRELSAVLIPEKVLIVRALLSE